MYRHDSDGRPVDAGEFTIRQGVMLEGWTALRRVQQECPDDQVDILTAWADVFAQHIRDLCDDYQLPVDRTLRLQSEFQEQLESDPELQSLLGDLGWPQASRNIQHELTEVQQNGCVTGYQMTLVFPQQNGSPPQVREMFFPLDVPAGDMRDSLESYAKSLIQKHQCRTENHSPDGAVSVAQQEDWHEQRQLTERGFEHGIDGLLPLMRKGLLNFAHGTEFLRVLQQKLHDDYAALSPEAVSATRASWNESACVAPDTAYEDTHERMRTLLTPLGIRVRVRELLCSACNLVAAEQFAQQSINTLRSNISHRQAAELLQEIQQKLHAAFTASPSCASPASGVHGSESPDVEHIHILRKSRQAREADVYLWISQAMKRLLRPQNEKDAAY